MRIFRGFDHLPHIKKPVVAIGSFDGVHRGHRLLIKQLCALARDNGGESVVITFDPHPQQLFKGDAPLLTTIDEKLTLLAETDLENVIVIDFTSEFSKISHTQFIEKYIIGVLNTQILITGEEHNFGHNRKGNAASVHPYGIKTHRFERFDNISSTQIRATIAQGEMAKAAELLGSNGYLIQTPIREKSKLIPPSGRKYWILNQGQECETTVEEIKREETEQKIIIIR